MLSLEQRKQIANSLRDKEYRDLFVSGHIHRGIAHQLRKMRDSRGWTQAELGERSGMAQEQLSRLENPDNERLSLRTLKRLASAFDVALVVRFVPFSNLVDWATRLSESDLVFPSFVDDSGLWAGEEGAETTTLASYRQAATTHALSFGSVETEPKIIPFPRNGHRLYPRVTVAVTDRGSLAVGGT